MPPERMDVLRKRKDAVDKLAAIVLENVPDGLPEIQQLRMRLSQARALFLAIEATLTSLHERELPRSMRTVDPNAYLVHIEARGLVEQALGLIGQAKEKL